jgi:hypothetical protein
MAATWKKDILAFSDGIDTITYAGGQRKKRYTYIREKEL